MGKVLSKTPSRKISIKLGNLRILNDDEINKINSKTNYYWVVENSFIYKDENTKIVVPKGFVCNGSDFSPDIGSAFIFHDYLYATHKIIKNDKEVNCERKEADDIMYDILLYERLYIFAFLFYYCCYFNPFYKFQKAWEISGERGPEFLKE